MRGFDDADRAALRRLFRALVVPVAGASAATGTKALALRACPRDELPPSRAMNRVVAALLDARILQSALIRTDAAGPGGVAILRIAHERVLESWAEARAILEENRRFFRMRAEIEAQWSAWRAQGGEDDWLLPAGRPVTEAEGFMREDSGGELPAPLHAFVARSAARERERGRIETRRQRLMRRLRGAATALGAAAAVLAVFALVQWNQARDVANAAKATVGSLVKTIGKDLSERDGIPPGLVTTSLRQVDGLAEGLQRRIGGDEAVERARAEMLFHFASAYKRAGGDAGKALETAQRSLDMREGLLRHHRDDPDLMSEKAGSYDLLGDLLRREGRPEDALDPFRKAQAIRIGLAGGSGRSPPEVRELRLIAVSKSFIRIGDVYAQRGSADGKASARDAYTSALRVAASLALVRAGGPAGKQAAAGTDQGGRDATLWRELSWPYRKLGSLDLPDNPERARASFEKALCLRRVVAPRSDEIEAQRDIGFSLRDVGQAHERAGQLEDARIVFIDALAFRRDLRARNVESADIQVDVAQSSHELAALLDRTGEAAAALDLLDDAAQQRRQLVRG